MIEKKENKKLMDDAENLKKQLKPLDDITNKVGKLKVILKRLLKNLVHQVEVVVDLEQVEQKYQVRALQQPRLPLIHRILSTTVTGTKTEKELEEEGL